MIPILILAAGTSSRMRGGDKLREYVGGEPLLRVQAKRALATRQPVFVALPRIDHPRHAVIADLDVTPLITPEATEGMSGTMRGGVALLPDALAFMLLLGDLVKLTTADLMRVIDARATHPAHLIWRGATKTGKPGHPIIFDQSVKPQFENLEGDGGGELLVKPLQARTHLVRFADDRARFDLDTPEEWQKWRNSFTEK